MLYNIDAVSFHGKIAAMTFYEKFQFVNYIFSRPPPAILKDIFSFLFKKTLKKDKNSTSAMVFAKNNSLAKNQLENNLHFENR